MLGSGRRGAGAPGSSQAGGLVWGGLGVSGEREVVSLQEGGARKGLSISEERPKGT